jgi:hypothetical protein
MISPYKPKPTTASKIIMKKILKKITLSRIGQQIFMRLIDSLIDLLLFRSGQLNSTMTKYYIKFQHRFPILQYQVLTIKGLFDQDYYLSQFTNSQVNLGNPITHFILSGAAQGRDPNPLFNTSYYLKHYPEVGRSGINPLFHFIRIGAKRGLNPGPFFETKFYLEKHKDVAQKGINPLTHWLNWGKFEGRAINSDERAIKLLSDAIVDSPEELTPTLYNSAINTDIVKVLKSSKIVILTNSHGNYYYREVRDVIAVGLKEVGLTVITADESFEDFSENNIFIIVAPQDFFIIGKGSQWNQPHILKRSILLCSDQIQTSWFALNLAFFSKVPLIFHLEYAHARLLNSLGYPVYFLPIGYLKNYSPANGSGPLPKLDALAGMPASCINYDPPEHDHIWQRPIDIAFVGTGTPRREVFFAKNCDFLADYCCFFYIVTRTRTLTQGKNADLNTDAFYGLSRRSKILLNIHRDEMPFFEWHRIAMQGLWQKTLVLTEPTLEMPGFRPGRDYISAESKDFPEIIKWILTTKEGMEKAEETRITGHENLKRKFDMIKILHWIIQEDTDEIH